MGFTAENGTPVTDAMLAQWIEEAEAGVLPGVPGPVRKAASRGETVTVSAEERMLTPEQAARRLGMHRSTVVRKINAGELNAVKVGSHHRIAYSEFLRFRQAALDSMTSAVAPEIEAELFGDQ